MQSLWQDLRYGVRMLLKNPGFTLIAVLTLGLGIGANTAIFSAVNGVLLSSLPYPQPEQLAMIWCDNKRQGIPDDITSYPNFIDWRDRNKTFQGMAGVTNGKNNLTGTGEPEEISDANVSINFFQLIGVNPILGRVFTAEEEQPGRDRVVVLSYSLWQRRFGGDTAILNKTITLNDVPHLVVGIMPPGFQFPEKTEIWGPLAVNEDMKSDRARFGFFLPVVGRLKPGVTRAQAQADLEVVAGQIEQQFPDMKGYGVNVVPVLENTVGPIRRALIILSVAVFFVLLIACANVANLLLARAAVRQREVAVRAALGAGRWRIIRQLLTESMLLAVLGGALGVLLAWWSLRLLVEFSPTNLPRLENIRLDGRVLWFTLVLSVLTGLIFGLAPALQTAHFKLSEMLKEGGRTGSGGRRAQQIRGAFIVAEVALTLALLAGAGLLVRSFWRLQQIDFGFNPDNVLTLRVTLWGSKYRERGSGVSFFERLQERLAAVPGVVSASATSDIMLPKLANSGIFTIENRPRDPNELALELPIDRVQPNYFQTMGIPLVKGRAFTSADTRDTPLVAIVNETFSKRYFQNEDPIGKRFAFGGGGPNARWITIVGVVGDTKRQGVDMPVRIESWMPIAQRGAGSMEIVLRTAGDPLALSNAVREAVWSLDKDLPIPSLQTLDHVLSQRVAQQRLNMLLLVLFASVALILAAVGIYGVMSYAVTQRTNEIGIRMALGAQASDVLRMIIWRGMSLALGGVALGLAGALALTRVMRNLLFEVSVNDPLTFIAIAVLLTAVAFLACLIPARRATKVDPMVALRYE
jgi:putative ABC transport system permease protein